MFGLFPFLASMNNAAVNICMQVVVWTRVFILSGGNPGVELLGRRVNFSLIYETTTLVSKVAVQLYVPTGVYKGSILFKI